MHPVHGKTLPSSEENSQKIRSERFQEKPISTPKNPDEDETKKSLRFALVVDLLKKIGGKNEVDSLSRPDPSDQIQGISMDLLEKIVQNYEESQPGGWGLFLSFMNPLKEKNLEEGDSFIKKEVTSLSEEEKEQLILGIIENKHSEDFSNRLIGKIFLSAVKRNHQNIVTMILNHELLAKKLLPSSHMKV
jgi:hypothetical protein